MRNGLLRSSIHGKVVALATVLAVLLLAGCGGSARRTGVLPGLPTALNSVSDSPAARAYFEWGDVPVLRRLNGIGPLELLAKPNYVFHSRWVETLGIGTGPISESIVNLAAYDRFNVLGADDAVSIGLGGSWATRLDGPGIDTQILTRELRGHGASGRGDLLSLPTALGAQNVSLPMGVSRVWASGHTAVFGGSAAAVSAVRGGGEPLGHRPAYEAASGCLGHVIWAVIAPAASVSKVFSTQPGPQLIAIGGRRPASASSAATEVLCLIDGSGAAGGANERVLRRAFGPRGILPRGNVPVTKVVAHSSIARADASGLQSVRAVLTLRRQEPSGFLFEELNSGELALFAATTCPPQGALEALSTPAARRQVCRRLGLAGAQ